MNSGFTIFVGSIQNCKMKKIFKNALYITAILILAGCAKTVEPGPYEADKRYLDAWLHLNHPDAEASGLGIYILNANDGNGVEVKDVIRKVYCYDTLEEEFVSFDASECKYGYRDSIFKSPEIKGRYVVTHVVFALDRKPSPKLDYGHLQTAVQAACADAALTPMQIRKVIIKIRKEKLPEPSVMGSAGSFFKNPVISVEHFQKIEAAVKAELGQDYKVPHYLLLGGAVKVPAAWLIEQCGWKGRRSGGAAVWEKQPLVIVNYTGEAYPEEIIGLENRIIASVKAKFGIELHPEVDHI